ncbi:MAG: peptidoglycan-binding protein [Clostridia bacterium]|nr:peptidoglycan-binding protein [Clostridia bacterium]
MQTLRFGDKGLYVRYLQAALLRAGEEPGSIDGIFGRRTERALTGFQNRFGLRTDGVAGRLTRAALYPFLTGAAVSILREGETVNDLADRFDTTPGRIRTANPSAAWTQGEQVVVPLGFDVVFTDVPYSAFLTACVLEGLTLRYPYLVRFPIGASVTGKRIEAVRIGAGPLRVGVNAAHHANEWITTPLVLLFLERYLSALSDKTEIGGVPAKGLFETSTLTLVPLVNPDGVDLVTGALPEGDSYYESARALSAFYPSIPFPDGWKANVSGIDLNLGYPAGWENARAIKFANGFTRPGPRDYVGTRPLEAPENRAMYELTVADRYDRAIAYHTQGCEIYWEYRGNAPKGARALAERFAEVSGYAVSDVPYDSGFAGYKDWVIGTLGGKGFTIEAGRGSNPLLIGNLQELYAQNEPLLVEALRDT